MHSQATSRTRLLTARTHSRSKRESRRDSPGTASYSVVWALELTNCLEVCFMQRVNQAMPRSEAVRDVRE